MLVWLMNLYFQRKVLLVSHHFETAKYTGIEWEALNAVVTTTYHHSGEKKRIANIKEIVTMCTSRWLRSLSRSAAMLFFTCCSAARSFLRELGLHPKTDKESESRSWINRKTLLQVIQVTYRAIWDLLNKQVMCITDWWFMRFFKAWYCQIIE